MPTNAIERKHPVTEPELREVEFTADLIPIALIACYYSEKGNGAAGHENWGRMMRDGVNCNRTGKRYSVAFQTMIVENGEVKPHVPGERGNAVRGLAITVLSNWRIEGAEKHMERLWFPLSSFNSCTLVARGVILE